MVTAKAPARASVEELRRRVEAVADPELPVLTLAQLGVIRDVRVEDGRAVVEITPTYSGCPAMAAIATDLAEQVEAAGFVADIRLVLSPAWTTDWITSDGRKALSEAGIAPPGRLGSGPVAVQIGRRRHPSPECPQCGSAEVEELARFGSTACKALWRCVACREPFDYVKPL
jgi:ring-1,2-phenylacetyl-CoA epoxidase subunit PaaD